MTNNNPESQQEMCKCEKPSPCKRLLCDRCHNPHCDLPLPPNPESQQECCEKCKNVRPFRDEERNAYIEIKCVDEDCPCHTPAPSQFVGWESTSEDLVDPLFNAVWDAIKGWDLERERGKGYAGATGTDVMTILKVVRPFLTQKEQEVRESMVEEWGFYDVVRAVKWMLDTHYPNDVFDGSSENLGPRFTAKLHEAMNILPADLRDRITKSK